jgi:hypothetical protein
MTIITIIITLILLLIALYILFDKNHINDSLDIVTFCIIICVIYKLIYLSF